ncbi:MAG: DUF4259 domain-containing protein [Gemmatimonadales bacterium]
MGAWGVGAFENDDASDWVYQLEEAGDFALVRDTLAAAAEPDGYLESPTCSMALAAAEVVAALGGRAAPDLPEEVRTWVRAHRGAVPDDLTGLSVRALDQVAADSELKELWAESDEHEIWVDRLQELRSRLVA